jgi:hypothetical protein
MPRIPSIQSHLPPDSAIEHARVEPWQVIVRGKRFGDCAFARGGRAIDGDYHSKGLWQRITGLSKLYSRQQAKSEISFLKFYEYLACFG